MATTKNFAGQAFNLPLNREPKSSGWGTEVSNFLIAVADNALTKTGGTFTLSAEMNFGATYGILLPYIKSASANIASSGFIRISNTDVLAWRNAANAANLALGVNGSDRLVFNSVVVPTVSSADALTNKTIVVASNTVTTAASGNLAAVELNAALAELQGDIDTRATSSALSSHTSDTANPHAVTKAQVGLGSVDNTSDATKNSAAVVLTNKDIDGGTASNTSRVTIPKASLSSLSALTRKQGTIVYDTTSNKMLVDDGSNLNAVGSGSGELTLVANPSDAANWSKTGSTGLGTNAPATTTTAGDLPLSGVVATAIKMTSGTGAGAEASHYNSYAFTTPASLASKLKVEFYMRPGSNFIASEWTVSVYAGSTRQSLSTDSSSITYLPNQAGKFTTTFDCVASTAYTLRFARTVNAGTNVGILNLANVIVGPGVQPQGAVVGDWQSYTPTSVSGMGTPSAYDCWWRRNGTNAELLIKITAGTPIAAGIQVRLPAGLTAVTRSTTYLLPGSVGTSYAGGTQAGMFPVVSSTYPLDIHVGRNNTASIITPVNGNAILGTGDVFQLTTSVPIAEWAGSGTINLAQNDVEFASNSTTSVADDTSSFAYGPSGSLTPSGSAGVSFDKTVRFQTPIQSTDLIMLEINPGGNTKWFTLTTQVDSADVAVGQRQLTETYGILWNAGVNATDITIRFGRYAKTAIAGAYGAAGLNWSLVTAGTRWRVRKVSGGAAVGFGIVNPGVSAGLVSASGVPGRTDGNVVPAGYVGENYTATAGAGAYGATTAANTWTDASAMGSVTLTTGVWLISYSVMVYMNQIGAVYSAHNVGLWDGSAIVSNSVSYDDTGNNTAGAVPSRTVSKSIVVNVVGSKTYSMRTRCSHAAASAVTTIYGTSISGAFTDPDCNSVITAVRIA